jgi:cell division septum initiation protein DivIVA
MPYIRLAALALATATFAVSGCGGSGKSTSQSSTQAASQSNQTSTETASSQASRQTTPTSLPAPPTSGRPLARAHLVAHANAVCQDAITKSSQLFAKGQDEFAALVPLVASYQRTMYDELIKLTPPASLASDWKSILGYARILAETTSKLSSYGQNDHTAAAQPLYTEFAAARRELHYVAARAGFATCAHA